MKVMKFGGTSVGSPERMKEVVNLILKDKKEVFVVLSAMSGTTNTLIEIADYLYKKNQAKVDDFLRKQGINIKTSSCSNLEGLDIEGLTEMKEHIEDLIAEKSATESAEEIIVAAE
mgnify:CR=1 FL=1